MSDYDSQAVFLANVEKYWKKFSASRAGIILIKVFNICFYVTSLTWIAYSTFIFSTEGLPRREGWFFYSIFHSTIVGVVTYKALIIDLKFTKSYFFIKNNLEAVFISFAVTAPLASIPFVIAALGRNFELDIFCEWPFTIILGGQLYWLLLPVQIAITVWGKKRFLLVLGYVVFFASMPVINFFSFVIYIGCFAIFFILIESLICFVNLFG